MLKPITLDEFKIPFWVRLLPFSKYSYIKKRINNIIISRCDHEVEDAWREVGISYGRITDILNIIAKYCDWKSIKFIPSDECSCVFMDYDLDLGAIVAISEIEESYQIKSKQLYEHLDPNSKLLKLIRFVLGELKEGVC